MTPTTQLDLSILLPKLDADDECVNILTTKLAQQRGIEKAHIVRDNGDAKLCLHYDPNLISLATVQRLAHEAGAEINQRYRHEQIPFTGMHSADAAPNLERQLKQLKGMIHASVSYAAGVIFVAYDSEVLQRETIERTIRGMGVDLIASAAPSQQREAH